MSSNPLLEVEQLKKYFPIKKGILRRTRGYVKAVDDVSFHVNDGETLGIVGESGCGKSTIARCIIRLLEPTSGSIRFQGTTLNELSKSELRKKRKALQMIFQDPFASLNPKMNIGDILSEPLRNFGVGEQKERKRKVIELLEKVGLNEGYLQRYPHEFSGGQRQRIGIARSLVLNPKLIIADEPVSALDVSIQSQILNLMKALQKEYGLTYLFISHDLSVVKHLCDRVGVMYLGNMLELADKQSLYRDPLHPYTRSLLSAVPIPDPFVKRERIVLSGDVPSPSSPPSGCPFHTRCPEKMDICTQVKPPLIEHRSGHWAACHLYS